MTDAQTFADLAFLLNLYPGVNAAVAYRCEDGKVQIRFRCRSFDSLKAIAECCLGGANEGIAVGPPWARFSSETTDCDDLPFIVSIANDWSAEAPPSQSQIIGIFLARDLKQRGLLAADLSHALQKGWNGDPQ